MDLSWSETDALAQDLAAAEAGTEAWLATAEARRAGAHGPRVDLDWAVASAGVLVRALRAAHAWAQEHEQGGKPLMKQQAVAFQLAEMLTLKRAVGFLLARAEWALATGDAEAALLARAARVFAAEQACRVAGDARLILGTEGASAHPAGAAALEAAYDLAARGGSLDQARDAIADELLRRYGAVEG